MASRHGIISYGFYPRVLYLTLSHHRRIHADCGKDNAVREPESHVRSESR
jgi:hypothetical protein